jgi:CheY-like chemotaxis protein
MNGKLKRILLAEDSENDAELTLSALAQHHLANEVVVVRDGIEAMDYLLRRGAHAERPEGDPAVVMLDIKMPKMDGLEVLQRMRADANLNRIPVVMLTSSREEHDIARSYEQHVNAYVVKPVDFQEFVDAVRALGLFWGVLNEPPPQPATVRTP